jgi:hypothetical protein
MQSLGEFMPKQAKASSAKAKSKTRQSGDGHTYEGGQHRPKEKDSKNDARARRR